MISARVVKRICSLQEYLEDLSIAKEQRTDKRIIKLLWDLDGYIPLTELREKLDIKPVTLSQAIRKLLKYKIIKERVVQVKHTIQKYNLFDRSVKNVEQYHPTRVVEFNRDLPDYEQYMIMHMLKLSKRPNVLETAKHFVIQALKQGGYDYAVRYYS